jgi:arylsulfatase A-like enzyme
MVLGSWRPDLLLFLPGVAAAFGSEGAKRFWKRLIGLGAKSRLNLAGLLLLATAVLNGAVIQLRNQHELHAELRYHPFMAIYYNVKAEKSVRALPRPTMTERMRARELLPGRRFYAADPALAEFPLWQTQVSRRDDAADEAAETGRRLSAFIRAEAEKNGPWNVVVMFSESLRAHEVEVFGDPVADYAGLTPQLGRLAADGITFSEAISGGLRTHYGQMLGMCSLYGVDDFGLLNRAPMTNAVCLPDVFADKSYDTFFFYGGDNHFDNQADFYTYHKMAHVFGEQHFPEGTAKGGWGFSDHAVFDFALAHLNAARPPFFAVVLSLTNHIPQKIPPDVPAGLLRTDVKLRQQTMQYVDWAIGDFRGKLDRQFPHTIFVFLADHGIFWDNEAPSMAKPSFEYLRRVARIPFVISIPGMPPELRGKKIGKLASNADVAPTLLSLLGWQNRSQQFMGQDAFTREGPVFIDWQQTLLRVDDEGAAGRTVHVVPEDLEAVLGGLTRFNLLAPPPR